MRLRKEDGELEQSPSYTARLSQKRKEGKEWERGKEMKETELAVIFKECTQFCSGLE